jgi:hypothetical protein
MLAIYDLVTDDSDDLIIDGDLDIEVDPLKSLIKVAQRRVSARCDDFMLENVGAGIERYLQKRINTSTKFQIQEEISRVLSDNNLFLRKEFKTILLDENEDGSLPIIIKLKSNFTDYGYSFRVLINNQNQRSYN